VNNSVAVLLNVTGMNNADNYSVLLDGQNAGNFNYNNANAQINVPGNGQMHTIVVTDSADPNCSASAQITTPNCSLPCNISINGISFGNAVVHNVNVQDFQFSPEEITINLGDTIVFHWTGVIPHTVTSDMPSGPNAFNSGLLSQNATWTLVPGSSGDFPYYCIPHGAPGGVGMSGVIHVTSACNGSLANGNLQISYTNTSSQGFIVTSDGNPVPDLHFHIVHQAKRLFH
jgi:plastocyanin